MWNDHFSHPPMAGQTISLSTTIAIMKHTVASLKLHIIATCNAFLYHFNILKIIQLFIWFFWLYGSDFYGTISKITDARIVTTPAWEIDSLPSLPMIQRHTHTGQRRSEGNEACPSVWVVKSTVLKRIKGSKM